jgi:CBS domain-containing protein
MRRWIVADVMTCDPVSVPVDASYRHVADTLLRWGVPMVPVVDRANVVIGVITEGDVVGRLEFNDRRPNHQLTFRRLSKRAGDGASDLMTSPAVTIDSGITIAQAARVMDETKLKRLPVVDFAGRLVGVVARRDLVRPLTRSDDELRIALVRELDELWLDDCDISVRVNRGAVTLSGIVERHSTARMVASIAAALPGVVRLSNELSYRVDDTKLVGGRR